ncbi:hypothetical protein GCM10028808_53820 [Spirosoma migulaei]
MEITLKGATFPKTQGNTRWVENYIIAAGIADPSIMATALRAFYTTMHGAGLDKKLEVLRLFITGSAAADALNLLNPVMTDAAYPVVFQNDTSGAHTTTGYTPNQSGRYGISRYMLKVGTTDFHMHVWNSGADAAGGYYMGHTNITAPSSVDFKLSRSGNVVQIGGNGATQVKAGSTPAGGVGLLSGTRNGNTVKMFSNGNQIATGTDNTTITPIANSAPIYEGTYTAISNTFATTAKLFCVAYGASA